MAENWLKDMQRLLFFELQCPDTVTGIAEHFDPELLASNLEKIGVQAVGWFAKDYFGNSYYPTKFPSVHPGLKRDMMGEGAEAFVRHGIKVIAYYHIPGNKFVAKEHPEWWTRQPDGEPRMDGIEHPCLCINGRYTEEVLLQQLREILSYPTIDGIFMDGSFLSWLCYCDFCKDKFRREMGREMPKHGEDGWRDLLAWQREQAKEFRRKVYATVQDVKPGAMITSNVSYSDLLPEDPPSEGIHQLVIDILGIRGRSNLRRLAAYDDFPVSVMTGRMTNYWYDWGLKPETQMILETATTIANRSQLYIGDMQIPWGTMEPAVLEGLGKCFTYCRDREEWLTGARAHCETAILTTDETLHEEGGGLSGNCAASYGALMGTMDNHCYALMMGEQQMLKRLAELRVVIVPGQTHMTDKMVAALEKFVSDGGNLIVTARSSMWREDNSRREEMGLAKALGIHYVQDSPQEHGYLRIKDDRLQPGLPKMDLLVHGRPVRAEARGAKVLASLVDPWNPGGPYVYCPHAGPNSPGPAYEETPYVGISVNEFGKGKAIYISCCLFSEKANLKTWISRPLLANILNLIDGQPLFETNAPWNVEVTHMTQKGRVITHLMNQPARWLDETATVESVAPVRDLECRMKLKAKPATVRLQPGEIEVNWKWDAPYVRFTLPRLDIHAMVVME